MRSIVGVILITLFIVNQAYADYADLRQRVFEGKVVEINTPAIVKIQTQQEGRAVYFFLELVDINFRGLTQASCNLGFDFIDFDDCDESVDESECLQSTLEKPLPDVEKGCELLDNLLMDKHVGVEIVEFRELIHRGYLTYKNKVVNFSLIENGAYGVDHIKTRALNLVMLEKDARCKRLGIWESKKGIREEDMKCQD